MSTATMNHKRQTVIERPAQETSTDPSIEKLFEEVLNRTPSVSSKKFSGIEEGLLRHIGKIEAILPDQLKGQAERFVRRAIMYFNRSVGTKSDLSECTTESLLQCIVSAAELGLAIDGRLAHAVKFKSKTDGGGWEAKSQLIVDYKGKIAIARRNKVIADIYGDVVGKNDTFEIGRNGDVDILNHKPKLDGERGEVIGCYMVVVMPNEKWHYEWMSRKELDYIQSRSKAQDFGPWKTDPNEMRKKTVVNRALKKYMDVDVQLAKAFSAVEEEVEYVEDTSPKTMADLNGAIMGNDEPKQENQEAEPPTALFETSGGAERI